MSQFVTWTPGVTLENVERQVIEKALIFYRGNKTATAGALGIAIRTLDNKLDQYVKDDLKSREDEHERKAKRENFAARCRGKPEPHPAYSEGASSNESARNLLEAGVRLESAPDAGTQPPLSMPERKQIQSVLPPQVAASGSGKRR